MITVVPFCAASTAASSIALVPVENLSNSKTPGGLDILSTVIPRRVNAHLPVPEDGLRIRDSCLAQFDGLLTTVQSLPSVGDTIDISGIAGIGILGELVGSDVVHGQNDLDIVLLRLLDEVADNLGTCLVKKRVSNADTLQSLLEGERHTAADDQLVDLGDQVVDELDLVGNFRTSEDGKERAFGALESLSKELELLLHEKARGLLGEVDADHGAVAAVGGTEGVVDVDVTKGSERLTEGLNGLGVSLLLLSVGVLGASLLLGVKP